MILLAAHHQLLDVYTDKDIHVIWSATWSR